jgi:glycosyltransferase involved in cell wall biosynthesis
MLRQAAAIHYTTSEERRQAEQSLGLQHGVVIPLGVDDDLLDAPDVAQCFRHHYPALGQHPYILVLARLHPVKRLELLLQAFLDLLHQAPFQAWRLVVAGDGEKSYVRHLQHLVSTRGKSKSVLFTGWLDTPMKTAALQGAALLAQPSQYENFGLSIAEALACETPVLISTQVNLADQIHDAKAGWVVPLHQAAIRRALEDALSHQSDRVARGRAGRVLVCSRFRWSVVAKELMQLYHKVTG